MKEFMAKKKIEMTEKDKKEMLEEYNRLVLKKYFQPYDNFPMTSGWYLFAFAFCLFCAYIYATMNDLFSSIYMAFMSGMNLIVFLEKSEE